MSDHADAIPPEVEDFLVGNVGDAGALGGGMSGSPGAAGGGRKGGQAAAARMRTKVAREECAVSGEVEPRLERITREWENAVAVPPGQALARYVVPLGRTGLQAVVVDIAQVDSGRVQVTGYAKEGLLSRKPAAKTARRVAELLEQAA